MSGNRAAVVADTEDCGFQPDSFPSFGLGHDRGSPGTRSNPRNAWSVGRSGIASDLDFPGPRPPRRGESAQVAQRALVRSCLLLDGEDTSHACDGVAFDRALIRIPAGPAEGDSELRSEQFIREDRPPLSGRAIRQIYLLSASQAESSSIDLSADGEVNAEGEADHDQDEGDDVHCDGRELDERGCA